MSGVKFEMLCLHHTRPILDILVGHMLNRCTSKFEYWQVDSTSLRNTVLQANFVLVAVLVCIGRKFNVCTMLFSASLPFATCQWCELL